MTHWLTDLAGTCVIIMYRVCVCGLLESTLGINQRWSVTKQLREMRWKISRYTNNYPGGLRINLPSSGKSLGRRNAPKPDTRCRAGGLLPFVCREQPADFRLPATVGSKEVGYINLQATENFGLDRSAHNCDWCPPSANRSWTSYALSIENF